MPTGGMSERPANPAKSAPCEPKRMELQYNWPRGAVNESRCYLLR